MVSTTELASTGNAIVTAFREKNVTFLAGSIAYNAFVSLVPLLLFFFVALAVAGAEWQARFLALVTNNVSPTVGQLVRELLQEQATGLSGSSLVGGAVLIWGALKLFRGLDTAFGAIYEVEGDASFVDHLVDGLVVLLSLVLTVVAILAVTSAVAVVSERVPLVGVVVPFVLAVGFVVALVPMFYVFPDTDVTPREILPGVLVAAVGWTLLQRAFHVYVAVSTGGGATSLVTGIMLLLTWLYFGGVVLLLGVVVNAVVGGYTGSEAARASPDVATD